MLLVLVLEREAIRSASVLHVNTEFFGFAMLSLSDELVLDCFEGISLHSSLHHGLSSKKMTEFHQLYKFRNPFVF